MSKPKTDKSQNEKIKRVVIELAAAQERFKNAKKEFEEKNESLSKQIRNYMFINGFTRFHFQSNTGNVIDVNNVKQKRIVWDIEKVKEKFKHDKDLLNEFLVKQYRINDMEGLIKYLKSCGVDPKKFKKFIDVEEMINEKRLNELSEVGEIDAKQLSGCYEVKENVGYIKITEKENSKE